jgi:hypothetical protein
MKQDDALRTAAALIGRKGGQAKTEAKIRAAQENGKKGGRPRTNPCKFCNGTGEVTWEAGDRITTSPCGCQIKKKNPPAAGIPSP